MQGDGRDPAGTGLEFALELLLLEIVDAHTLAGGDEEEGLRGVESGGLGEAAEAAEGVLRKVLAEGVDGDCRGGCVGVGADGGEVVAATVPDESLGHGAELDGEVDALRTVCRDRTVPGRRGSLVRTRSGLELWVGVGVVECSSDNLDSLVLGFGCGDGC